MHKLSNISTVPPLTIFLYRLFKKPIKLWIDNVFVFQNNSEIHIFVGHLVPHIS